MDTLTLKQWTKYRDLLKKINDKAAEEFRDAVFNVNGRWHGVGLSQIPRDELIDYAYALVTKYSEASATVAAEMYDAIAALQQADVAAAIPAPTASYDETAKMVNGIIKQSENPDMLAGGITRLVKRAGCDTTLSNAYRDRARLTGKDTRTGRQSSGAQVAWVPSGDTCPFCIALASRGWQSQTQWAASHHAEHIHGNCDCVYMVRFNNNLSLEGYDPDEYLKEYEDADGNTPEKKLNSMRRENYAKNKEEINAQKRSAYEKRKELNSSEAEEQDVN